jgi:hypothetical protein
VSFATITLCVASQQVFNVVVAVVVVVILLLTWSGNFWICPCTHTCIRGGAEQLTKYRTSVYI